MTIDAPDAKKTRYLLPILVLPLAGAVALVAYAAFVAQDVEAATAQIETKQRTTAAAYARAAKARPAAVRRAAIRAAADAGKMRRELVRAPANEDDVRASMTFCETAEEGDVPALREALHATEHPMVVSCCVRALTRLNALLSDPALASLLSDRRAGVRQEIVMALGATDSPQAVPLLKSLLADKDPMAGLMARSALARIDDDAARAALRDVAVGGMPGWPGRGPGTGAAPPMPPGFADRAGMPGPGMPPLPMPPGGPDGAAWPGRGAPPAPSSTQPTQPTQPRKPTPVGVR